LKLPVRVSRPLSLDADVGHLPTAGVVVEKLEIHHIF
jgi:hypothetical protein